MRLLPKGWSWLPKEGPSVMATLMSATPRFHEEEEGSFFASSVVRKFGWVLNFDNGMMVFTKERMVQVGAKYKIFDDGGIERVVDNGHK